MAKFNNIPFYFLLLAVCLFNGLFTNLQAITVGSKNFTEQLILAEIMAQLIEDNLDEKVARRLNLGGTHIAFEALRAGNIDLYPEYVGTGIHAILNEPAISDPFDSFVRVQKSFRDRYGLEWLTPFGFDNGYAIAMKNTSDSKRISSISDLNNFQKKLKVGCVLEFMERADGWFPLAKKYGFEEEQFKVIALDPGLMYVALDKGDVDLIVTFYTDGRIAAHELKVLQDDLGFFPSYQAAPLISAKAITHSPSLPGVLNLLGGTISSEDMRTMNWRVDGLGHSPEVVAREFLTSKGLIIDTKPRAESKNSGSLLQHFLNHRSYLLQLLMEHLLLTLSAISIAIIVGIPAGIFFTRYDHLSGPFFTGINTVQTIPSLALLGFLIPLIGIGPIPAIITLFLYALLPIVRNTYTGIKQIPPMIIESSTAIGLTNYQILRKVELPLAVPMILAGIRTSTVIIVGTATLAALIGAGGFGDPIFRGISMVKSEMILLGAVPAAVLAVVLDRLLFLLEGAMKSPGLEANL